MKIGLATSGDFISNFLINEIYKKFPDDELFILIDENVGKVDTNFMKKITYFEHIFPEKYIYPLVENINLKTNKYLTYNQLTKQKNINLFRFININKQEELLKSLNLDVIISMRFRTIFKDNIIAIPKYGIYNIHSGILPKYRGACCLLQSVNNNEKYIGCSIHKILPSQEIDMGKIAYISKTEIDLRESYVGLNIKMFLNTKNQIISLLKKLKNNKYILLIDVDIKEGKYYKYPTQKEIDNFLLKINGIMNISDAKIILNRYV